MHLRQGRTRVFIAALAATILLAGHAIAQEKRTVSLDEAIDLGIKNSKQLKNGEAKVEEASAALEEARQKKLPSFH